MNKFYFLCNIFKMDKILDLTNKYKSSGLFSATIFFVSLFVFLTIGVAVLTPKIPLSKVATGTPVKQAQIIAGQDVKWKMLVEKSQIRDGKYLVQLPKGAKNISVASISGQQAKTIFTTPPTQQASLGYKFELAVYPFKNPKHDRSFIGQTKNFFAYAFSGINSIFKYFFAELEGSLENVVIPTLDNNPTPDVVVETPDAVYVDVSSEVISNPTNTIFVTDVVVPTSETATETAETTDPVIQPDDAPTDASNSGSTTETPEAVVSTSTPETTTPATTETEATSTPEAILSLEDFSEYVSVEYTTDAPEIVSQETDQGQQVTVSAANEDPQAPLVDILASTKIPEIFKVGQEDQIKIEWENNNNQEVAFNAYDTNNNGKLDYVEWTVPHLSTQTFNIIFISKAFHYDSDETLLSDIYDTVKEQDNNYITITNNQFIRVTFEKTLTNKNDNTIFARSTNGQPVTIESYPVYTDADGNVTRGPKVATFENITTANTYKVLLTSLQTPTDVFDLKVLGSVDFDYIVDPPNNIGACGYTISSGGEYILTANISSSSGNCITVDTGVTNVIIDGANTYSITNTGTNSGDNGINISQTFNIIYISKAFQLDAQQNIIADVYNTLKTKDDSYKAFARGEYVRVTFERILNNKNDVTLYARNKSSAGAGKVEVYPVYENLDGTLIEGQLVATFKDISQANYFKILLTNLQKPTDTFDLKIVRDVEIDYVVDPVCPNAWAGTGVEGDECQVNNCGTIDVSGFYKLTTSISSPDTCLTITASDVSIDGQNSNVINYDTGGMIDNSAGIYIPLSQSGITIKNFNNGTGDGISDGGAGSGSFMTVIKADQGLSNSYIQSNVLKSLSTNGGNGVNIIGSSSGNTISGNIMSSTGFTINLGGTSTSDVFYLNTLNPVQGAGIYIDGLVTSGSISGNTVNSNYNGMSFPTGFSGDPFTGIYNTVNFGVGFNPYLVAGSPYFLLNGDGCYQNSDCSSAFCNMNVCASTGFNWVGGDLTYPNDWPVTGNWQGGVVPTEGVDVTIPNTSGMYDPRIIYGYYNDAFSGITLGTVTIDSGATLYNNSNINAGTYTGSGTLYNQDYATTYSTILGGTFNIYVQNGVLATINGGTFTGIVDNYGTIDLTDGTPPDFTGATVNNFGTINCPPNLAWNGNTCVSALLPSGASCVTGTDCISNSCVNNGSINSFCTDGNSDSPCAYNSDCTAGGDVCAWSCYYTSPYFGKCCSAPLPGTAGPCDDNSQCETGYCTGNSACGCAPGNYWNGNYCEAQLADESSCSADDQCTSGHCGLNFHCTSGNFSQDCLSDNSCVEGSCGLLDNYCGGRGASCNTTSDCNMSWSYCTSGTAGNSATWCNYPAGDAGASCGDNYSCASGNCSGGICIGNAATGASCSYYYDCGNSSCAGGVCGGPGASCTSDGGCISGSCINSTCTTLVSSIDVIGAGNATTVVNGQTLQMSASILPVDATDQTIAWSRINGTGTATINSSGLLSATGVGTVTVRATAQDGSGIYGEVQITVTTSNVPVTGVSLSENAVTVTSDTPHQLTATIAPTNATNSTLSWSSSNPTAALVSSMGLVTVSSSGASTITVTTFDGGFTDSVAVTTTAIVRGGGTPTPAPTQPEITGSTTVPQSIISYISSSLEQIRQSILKLFGAQYIIPAQPTTQPPSSLQPTTRPPLSQITNAQQEGINIYSKMLNALNSLLGLFIRK